MALVDYEDDRQKLSDMIQDFLICVGKFPFHFFATVQPRGYSIDQLVKCVLIFPMYLLPCSISLKRCLMLVQVGREAVELSRAFTPCSRCAI